MTERADVALIGAGVIGLFAAWRLAERGLSVITIDPAPGRGASHAAAGMLAPLTEYTYGEDALSALLLRAAAGYAAEVADLETASGHDVGYRRCGALQVAWDASDLAALRELDEVRRARGLASQLLSGRELRALEPTLAPGLPGGMLAADDHQVDNRRLVGALRSLVPVREARAAIDGREVVLDDGGRISAGTVVVAAGADSSRLAGLAEPPAVRPVRGQTLRLRCEPGLAPTRVIRGTVRGTPVYLVPRADGELVVGASSEEAGFDLRARTGAVHDLIRDAQALVPALAESEWVEVSTGLRPGTRDNLPIVRSAGPGLILSTGHFRNGVLLAPLTARLVTALVTGEPAPEQTPLIPDGETA